MEKFSAWLQVVFSNVTYLFATFSCFKAASVFLLPWNYAGYTKLGHITGQKFTTFIVSREFHSYSPCSFATSTSMIRDAEWLAILETFVNEMF